MDKTTVLNAYRALGTDRNPGLQDMPHGMKAGLQIVRLRDALDEGRQLDEAQQGVIESYSEDGRTVDSEYVDAFKDEMEEVLDGDAETDEEDVPHLDLAGFRVEGEPPEGPWGKWIQSLIAVGAVDKDDAFDLLAKIEEADEEGEDGDDE